MARSKISIKRFNQFGKNIFQKILQLRLSFCDWTIHHSQLTNQKLINFWDLIIKHKLGHKLILRIKFILQPFFVFFSLNIWIKIIIIQRTILLPKILGKNTRRNYFLKIEFFKNQLSLSNFILRLSILNSSLLQIISIKILNI